MLDLIVGTVIYLGIGAIAAIAMEVSSRLASQGSIFSDGSDISHLVVTVMLWPLMLAIGAVVGVCFLLGKILHLLGKILHLLGKILHKVILRAADKTEASLRNTAKRL